MSHTKGYIDSDYREMAAGLLCEHKQRLAARRASLENAATDGTFFANATGVFLGGRKPPNR